MGSEGQSYLSAAATRAERTQQQHGPATTEPEPVPAATPEPIRTWRAVGEGAVLERFIELLPVFDPAWSEDLRQQWFACFRWLWRQAATFDSADKESRNAQ
jgi:hypothetical protein